MKLKYNLKQDFPEEGVLFVDFMPTFTDYNLMNDIVSKIVKKINSIGHIDYIIMPESRGYLLGALVANRLETNMLPIRKHGKLPLAFVGAVTSYNTEYSTTSLDIPFVDLKDKTCYFIDDVYATGGTYNACKVLVDKMGGHMLGGYCLYSVGLDNNEEIDYILSREDIEEEMK